MSKNVVRTIFFLVALLTSGVGVVAQEVASATVDLCETGQGAEDSCVGVTEIYLDALAVQGLSDASFSQELTNFVLALVALAQADAECNGVDNEIGKAVELASTFALDPEQIASLFEIGNTVKSCADFQTAAINPVSPN